ncbi:DEAD/DEAH box helicase [Bradyrhizobium sp. USDA 4502]
MNFPRTIKLWPHQARAVRMASTYLGGTRQGKAQKSALVNIPTGGGKTAVIGTIGHWHPEVDVLLVVAPRTAIRNQLARELGGERGFFLRSGFGPNDLPKSVLLLESASDLPDNIAKGTIFVSTIQLINELARNRSADPSYDKLRKQCDAVIVDEGHYEPAAAWSMAIRGLELPTVLVTATPYRNDLKPFDFDHAYVHVSRYSELVSAGFLREVDISPAPSRSTSSPARFVDTVLDHFIAKYGEPPSERRKLIIRCRSKEQIERIGELMLRHRHGAGGVLCLHEAFAADSQRAWEKRHPSDPEAPGAPAIWVHQHKLLEGVDGPSFRALAFYGVLGSARALVQQIGRVIRNPTKDLTENALLIDHSDGVIADMWRRFREYDASIDEKNLKLGLDDFAKSLEANLPPVVYADRQFRRRFGFNMSEADARRSLRLPLRCHLYAINHKRVMNRLAAITEERLTEAEYPFQTVVNTDDELIVLFVKLGTSPLLAEHFFIERELHAFIARKSGPVMAVLDTSRAGLESRARLVVGHPVTRRQMGRLLSKSPNTRLVEIVARNAALGPSAVRRRSATAVSLEETPPALDEFQFMASSVTAADARTDDIESFSFRSIGFGTARISDESTRKSLDTWYDWTESLIAAAADGTRTGHIYLDRFAQALDGPPQNPWPRSVLLDLDEARQSFVTHPEEESLNIEDVCLDCRRTAGSAPEEPRAFRITANGRICHGSVAFDRSTGEYVLESADLSRLYRYADGTRHGTMLDFLNTRQAFSIVPETVGVIYSESGFFDPRLGLGARFDPTALGLDDMIRHVPYLRNCTSEKGAQGSALPNGWAQNSVFEWIDQNVTDILPDAELVLCDDGRGECCDFLLAGHRGGREIIVMVHAKASKDGSFVSASALHEVCSQAAKQIGTISQFNPIEPKQIALWSGTWEGPGGEGTVDLRVRRSQGAWHGLDGIAIWARLRSLLLSQSTDREVVMVLGAALERDRLFTQARRQTPPAPAVHCIHLLRSTMAAVAGVNARLRVFCG